MNRDLCVKMEEGILNIRVGAIIMKEDKFLMVENDRFDHMYSVGGRIKFGETAEEAVVREVYEETGAVDFDMKPICVYSVIAEDNFDGEESFGMLYYADIKSFEKELHSEIERIMITDELPAAWTYPEIQPKLIEEAKERGILILRH